MHFVSQVSLKIRKNGVPASPADSLDDTQSQISSSASRIRSYPDRAAERNVSLACLVADLRCGKLDLPSFSLSLSPRLAQFVYR